MNQEIKNQERERLSALHRYSILDTPTDPRFDNLTQIAATSCDVPVALISFVDEDRLWIKSGVGFEALYLDRANSFCHATLEQGETLIVPDALEDPRFANHPLVTGPTRVRFYAGTPLTTSDGFHLGTLSILDRRPRHLLKSQKRILEHLARTAMLELDVDLHQESLKNVERVLHHSTRLASVHEFTAGIAHEISNPLAIIHARMTQLKRLASAEKMNVDAIVQSAGKVEKVVDRIHSIVQGLRSFATNEENDAIESVSTASLIQDSLFFLEDRLSGSGIDFKVEDLDTYEAVRLKGRSVQICQALLNLLFNACDALEDTSEKKWIRIRFRSNEHSLQIRVCDGGHPIRADLIDRIFQPYFTTKNEKKGTGLGLSVSRSLIESFGGKLYLDQNESEKAFVIELLKA